MRGKKRIPETSGKRNPNPEGVESTGIDLAKNYKKAEKIREKLPTLPGSFLSLEKARADIASTISKVAPDERPVLALQLVKTHPPQTTDQAIEVTESVLEALPSTEQQSFVWNSTLKVVHPSQRIKWACKLLRSGLPKEFADGIIKLIYKFNEINMMPESEQRSSQLEVLSNQLAQAISGVPEAEKADLVQGVMDKLMAVVPEHLQERVINRFRSRYGSVMENAKLNTLRKRVETYITDSVEDILALWEIWEEVKSASDAEREIVQRQIKIALNKDVTTTVNFVMARPKGRYSYLQTEWYNGTGLERDSVVRFSKDGQPSKVARRVRK